MQGNPQAAVVLVEYADYQCPYCGEAFPLVKRLQQRFGDDLCVVFRNFPLVEMHPQALPAAIVAEYAATVVKKSVVGTGSADKDQVGFMIARLLPTAGKTTSDAADALAVAIAHAHHRKVRNLGAAA